MYDSMYYFIFVHKLDCSIISLGYVISLGYEVPVESSDSGFGCWGAGHVLLSLLNSSRTFLRE